MTTPPFLDNLPFCLTHPFLANIFRPSPISINFEKVDPTCIKCVCGGGGGGRVRTMHTLFIYVLCMLCTLSLNKSRGIYQIFLICLKKTMFYMNILHNQHWQLFGVHCRIFFLNSSGDLVFLISGINSVHFCDLMRV